MEDIDRTKVYTAENLMEKPAALTLDSERPAAALRLMEEEGMNNIIVVDDQQKLVGYVTREDLLNLIKENTHNIASMIHTDIPEVEKGTMMDELFDVMHTSETPVAVTKETGEIEGVIVRSNIIEAMSTDYELNGDEREAEIKEESSHE